MSHVAAGPVPPTASIPALCLIYFPLSVTHHHYDHVGALPLLLEAYPDTPVLFHEEESPFLLDDQKYNATQPGNLQARLLRWIVLLGDAPVKASICMHHPQHQNRQRGCLFLGVYVCV
jgi:metal-dependent hydrolase (beta-lactamase superfamily II)